MTDVTNISRERALIPVSSPREHQTAQQRTAAQVRQVYGGGGGGNRARQDSVTLSAGTRPGVAPPAPSTSKAAVASIQDTPHNREQVRATYAHPQTSIDPAPTPGSLINIRV